VDTGLNRFRIDRPAKLALDVPSGSIRLQGVSVDRLKSLRWQSLLIAMLIGIAFGYLASNLVKYRQPIPLSKLLDWPVITFVIVVAFFMLFSDAPEGVISKGELTIGWGKDQNIQIRNLSSAVSGELSPLQEDIDALKVAVAKLNDQSNNDLPLRNIPGSNLSSEVRDLSASGNRKPGLSELIAAQLREALGNPRYKWRTVERLAGIAGVSEDHVLSILTTLDDVRLSRSMTGHQIAGLRTRVGGS
jgi:hypothetical protein